MKRFTLSLATILIASTLVVANSHAAKPETCIAYWKFEGYYKKTAPNTYLISGKAYAYLTDKRKVWAISVPDNTYVTASSDAAAQIMAKQRLFAADDQISATVLGIPPQLTYPCKRMLALYFLNDYHFKSALHIRNWI